MLTCSRRHKRQEVRREMSSALALPRGQPRLGLTSFLRAPALHAWRMRTILNHDGVPGVVLTSAPDTPAECLARNSSQTLAPQCKSAERTQVCMQENRYVTVGTASGLVACSRRSRMCGLTPWVCSRGGMPGRPRSRMSCARPVRLNARPAKPSAY